MHSENPHDARHNEQAYAPKMGSRSNQWFPLISLFAPGLKAGWRLRLSWSNFDQIRSPTGTRTSTSRGAGVRAVYSRRPGPTFDERKR